MGSATRATCRLHVEKLVKAVYTPYYKLVGSSHITVFILFVSTYQFDTALVKYYIIITNIYRDELDTILVLLYRK